MTHTAVVRLMCLCLAPLAVGCGSVRAQSTSPSDAPLRRVATIALPRVSGRIDHLAFDARAQRLFVSALGNNTVEVIDTARGALVTSLPGFHEPQGAAIVPDAKGVAIANGDTGTLQLVDIDTLETKWTKNVGGDADNVRYDAMRKRLYVAVNGGIDTVDPASGNVLRKIAINGHPESFQLEQHSALMYANVPDASEIVFADRDAGVKAQWPAGRCGANFPMALDETAYRVYVGCRSPATVAAFDTANGRLVASVGAVGDADDLFYDQKRKQIYVIGGGAVDVVSVDGDTLRRTGRVLTRPGARTGLWVADQDRLYLAVPARGGEPAEVRVFEVAEESHGR